METKSTYQELKKHCLRFTLSTLLLLLVVMVLLHVRTYAASFTVDLGTGTASDGTGVLDILLLFAILALLPSIIMMMTSFVRIIIVLSFLRNALGLQQSPPNQVLIGISLFLTLFIMQPVISEIKTNAYDPYKEGTITQSVAVERATVPLKTFMLSQTKEKELNLFLSASGQAESVDLSVLEENPERLTELGLEIIVPAFITSELKHAFAMGFYLFIPFLIIDMVVSSTLMSMGMVMLPPSMISLPFKIMLFVLVDGWSLLFDTLIRSF